MFHFSTSNAKFKLVRQKDSLVKIDIRLTRYLGYSIIYFSWLFIAEDDSDHHI